MPWTDLTANHQFVTSFEDLLVLKISSFSIVNKTVYYVDDWALDQCYFDVPVLRTIYSSRYNFMISGSKQGRAWLEIGIPQNTLQ